MRNMYNTGALQGLNLEKKESQLYLALLELGEATVLEIAKKSGVKRPTAYLGLQSLEEKGFVTKSKRGTKIFWTPQHPQKLLTEAEFRLKELKEAIPQLESLLQKGNGKPRVVIYEGKERLDQAYDESFVSRGEVLYMSSLELAMDVFPRTFKKINEYVELSPDFRLRELLDESEKSRAYAKQNRRTYHDIRFIPKELSNFKVDLGIFGNRVLVSSVEKDYFTVSIESEDVAHAFRVIFEMMWRAAQE